VLAILEILYGLLMLLAAAGSFVLASVIDLEEIFRQAGMEIPQEIIDAVPFFFGMVGVVLLIMAFLAFLIAYGFLKGRGWSWTLAMVLLVLSIIFSVLSWILSGLKPCRAGQHADRHPDTGHHRDISDQATCESMVRQGLTACSLLFSGATRTGGRLGQ